MLSEKKPKFESDLKQLLYNGFRAAVQTTFLNTESDSNIPINVQQQIDKAAQAFAQAFVDTSAQALADAIDEYIRSIGITIVGNVPELAILSSPTGAVSGSLNILPQNVKID